MRALLSAISSLPLLHTLAFCSALFGIKREKTLKVYYPSVYNSRGRSILLQFVMTKHLCVPRQESCCWMHTLLWTPAGSGRAEQEHLTEECDALKRQSLAVKLAVSWMRLVLRMHYMLGVHPCNFDVHWFKGLQVISLGSLVLISTFIHPFINITRLSISSSISGIEQTGQNVILTFGYQRIFSSAVQEWDSEALFKVKRGSGKDNSFIPVFITKHKFYINSLSKGSLTLFPFPMLN